MAGSSPAMTKKGADARLDGLAARGIVPAARGLFSGRRSSPKVSRVVSGIEEKQALALAAYPGAEMPPGRQAGFFQPDHSGCRRRPAPRYRRPSDRTSTRLNSSP